MVYIYGIIFHMALLRSNLESLLTILFVRLLFFFYMHYNNTIYLILSYLILSYLIYIYYTCAIGKYNV